MPENEGFRCRRCGALHDGLPLSFLTEAPVYWAPEMAARTGNTLTSDLCVFQGENLDGDDQRHFFLHGLIEIPIVDMDETFAWGVWVSLSRDSFTRVTDHWEEPDRENDSPYFGWLSTVLPLYAPTTLNLKTNVHTRPVGMRPLVELEPTDHPLAVEQRVGITRARVQEIAEQLLHPDTEPPTDRPNTT